MSRKLGSEFRKGGTSTSHVSAVCRGFVISRDRGHPVPHPFSFKCSRKGIIYAIGILSVYNSVTYADSGAPPPKPYPAKPS